MKKAALIFYLLTRSFTETLESDLETIEALHAEAKTLEQNHEYKRAIRTYQDILFIEPDDDQAYASMGRDYAVLGDADRARAAFGNALHINPENETALAGSQKLKDPDL